MKEALILLEDVKKHYIVSVPNHINAAKVEILTFRGAPAFLGTMLAKLYFDNKTIILYSKMSGVVNRILVNNDEIVSCGQRLFELRNTNISRTRSGNKMQPSNSFAPKPSCNFFFIKKKPVEKDSTLLNKHLFEILQNKL